MGEAMRSRRDYIVTKDEVCSYANDWLSAALRLEKGFFSVAVISYLKRTGHGFIIPAAARRRKPKAPKQATGLRALLKKNNGYYQHTLQSNVGGKRHSAQVTICGNRSRVARNTTS